MGELDSTFNFYFNVPNLYYFYVLYFRTPIPKFFFEILRRGVDYIACGKANHTLAARYPLTMKHQTDTTHSIQF